MSQIRAGFPGLFDGQKPKKKVKQGVNSPRVPETSKSVEKVVGKAKTPKRRK